MRSEETITDEPISEPAITRYFRNPRVVLVRKLDEDHFEVTDENKQHPYVITKAMLAKDYEVLY